MHIGFAYVAQQQLSLAYIFSPLASPARVPRSPSAAALACRSKELVEEAEGAKSSLLKGSSQLPTNG